MKRKFITISLLALFSLLSACTTHSRISTAQDCKDEGGYVLAHAGQGVKEIEYECGPDAEIIGFVEIGDEGGYCCSAN